MIMTSEFYDHDIEILDFLIMTSEFFDHDIGSP
jgi:hypothetical protein